MINMINLVDLRVVGDMRKYFSYKNIRTPEKHYASPLT